MFKENSFSFVMKNIILTVLKIKKTFPSNKSLIISAFIIGINRSNIFISVSVPKRHIGLALNL